MKDESSDDSSSTEKNSKSLEELEYSVNLSIFFHADTIRQNRMNGFLSMNAFLLAAIGLVSGSEMAASVKILVPAICLIGFVLSRALRHSHVRNDLFLKYRRFQLRDLEAKSGKMSTFSNSKTAFESGRLEFPHSSEVFETNKLGKYNTGQIDRFVIDTFSIVWLLILSSVLAMWVAPLIW